MILEFSLFIGLVLAGVFGFSKAAQSYAIDREAPVFDGVQISSQDIDILARTVWGEARGDGYDGMQAVANVVMNRFEQAQLSSAKARQFGSTVSEICTKPYQFSAWNANDPNRNKMLNVTAEDSKFKEALLIAEYAISGLLPDITNGADHYHTTSVSAYWSQGQIAVAKIKSHEFYKLG